MNYKAHALDKKGLVREVCAALSRGWKLTPLDGKRPILTNWPAVDMAEAGLLDHVDKGGNIGVLTGAASGGLVVLDFDTKDGGLSQHEELLSRLPDTVEAVTGSGGRHLYYRHDALLGNSAGKLAPHVDIKADGGQVVLPGSVHLQTGQVYAWMEGRDPDSVPLAALPQWVADALRKPVPPPRTDSPPRPTPHAPAAGISPYAQAALDRETESVRSEPEGTRNDRLNAGAFCLGQLVAGGELDEQAVMEALRAAALDAGLPPGEVDRTIQSGMTKGKTEPRTAPPRGPGHAHGWGNGDTAASVPAETSAPDPAETDGKPDGDGLLPLQSLPPGWREQLIPPRRFALHPAFPLGALSVLFAAGGTGKSTLLLTACASLVLGRGLVPGWRPEREGRALYLSFEDDFNEVHRRLQRIANAHAFSLLETERVSSNLKLVCVRDALFLRPRAGGAVDAGPALEQLRKTLAECGPFDLVVLDPKNALLAGTLDENGNALAQKVTGLFTDAVGNDTAVVLADHTSKAERGTAQSARGAGAWTDSARQAWSMRPLIESEARAVPEMDRPLVCVLSCLKTNYTAPIAPLYLRRRTDPDAAGALELYDLKTLKEDAECRSMNELRAAVLSALQETPATLTEITGHAKSDDAKARGERVKNAIEGILRRQFTEKQLRAAVESLLADNELVEETGDKGRRVLRPAFPTSGRTEGGFGNFGKTSGIRTSETSEGGSGVRERGALRPPSRPEPPSPGMVAAP